MFKTCSHVHNAVINIKNWYKKLLHPRYIWKFGRSINVLHVNLICMLVLFLLVFLKHCTVLWCLMVSWFVAIFFVCVSLYLRDNLYKCSITSETLLWILCSSRSKDVKQYRWSVGPGSVWPRNRTTMFQNVMKNCTKFKLIVAWVGKTSNVKDFGDVTLAWEDEEQERCLIFENFKWKWKYQMWPWPGKMVWN